MTQEIVVAVGQKWVSRDPRHNGRTVKVITVSRDAVGVENIDTGRRTAMATKTLLRWYRLAFEQDAGGGSTRTVYEVIESSGFEASSGSRRVLVTANKQRAEAMVNNDPMVRSMNPIEVEDL